MPNANMVASKTGVGRKARKKGRMATARGMTSSSSPRRSEVTMELMT